MEMQRVMIIGGSGSGKSTLAKRLGLITGLPVVHIDPMFWAPGWHQRSAEETTRLARAAAASEKWIFEGNHSATWRDRLARADTVIFLDVGTLRRMWRIFLRTVKYWGRSRPDMTKNCPEHVDWAFLVWAAGYAKDGRVKALSLLRETPSGKRVVHLTTPAQVDSFLSGAAE
jgi:adenylate kinase family enzyme